MHRAYQKGRRTRLTIIFKYVEAINLESIM